jgi:hypothetical protein
VAHRRPAAAAIRTISGASIGTAWYPCKKQKQHAIGALSVPALP